MAYFTAEEIAKAREVDLLSYLRSCEPHQLVRISGETYCTREHDSLKISNGKWHWFSRSVGGKTALDYLIKVQGYSFIQAMEAVLGQRARSSPSPAYTRQEQERELLLMKVQGYSSEEIGRAFGISASAVRSRLQKIKKN